MFECSNERMFECFGAAAQIAGAAGNVVYYAAKGGMAMTAMRECREPSARRKAELDPSCYRTLAAFRKAVANGTVDVSKACRTMGEYRWSLEHGKV